MPPERHVPIPSGTRLAAASASGTRHYARMDLSSLRHSLPLDGAPMDEVTDNVPDSVEGLRHVLGGRSFAGGLYRVHREAAAARWASEVAAAFPDFAHRITCFGYDWLGRQFALDGAQADASGQPLVLLFEPGTGEALSLPVNLAQFHETELIQEADAALAEPFYREWRTWSGDDLPLGLDECVGYRMPLFLSGKDEVDNLERTNADVYWSLTGQMRQQIHPG
jgi:hypothetical protein